MMGKYSPDIPGKLWATANLIVGFAAAQTMAYLLALGNENFGTLVGQRHVAIIIFVCTFFSSVLYYLAVWWCHINSLKWCKAINMDQEIIIHYEKVSREMTIGRIIALFFFWLLAAVPAFFVDGKIG